MQTRFLLGPAGSGKTFRCLAEVRAALAAAPAGPPLIFLAPKQATFQIERQLLESGEIAGFTRLHILSFDRLAQFIFEQLHIAPPKLLSDEGRLMVLRALLLRHAGELKLFKNSARRGGFAQELGALLAELQQHQLGPAKLRALSASEKLPAELCGKLHDLALLSEKYADWLHEHGLQDSNCLLDFATETLRGKIQDSRFKIQVSHLWLDGFAEMTPQELALLAAIIPRCRTATLAFCLETEPTRPESWLSIWSAIGKTFQSCREQLKNLPGSNVEVEVLARNPMKSRFAPDSDLALLEEMWTLSNSQPEPRTPHQLSIVACANPEAEAVHAARAILQFVRAGNRYRDCAVLVRNLETHHKVLSRVFRRYEIPFFLDRRENVAHHPLAELTRNALRTVAFDWQPEDFFAALKCGFSSHNDKTAEAIDNLENSALEFGWCGKRWREPLPDETSEATRAKVIRPFTEFYHALQRLDFKPTGAELAAAFAELWDALDVETVLERWTTDEADNLQRLTQHASPHQTVWEQMNAWRENLALAFPREALPLRDWLPTLEAGLGNLTVGVIPPSLDEVLVGAIDRARNPNLKFALLLGVNETIFPAVPAAPVILTASDRDELDTQNIRIGPSSLDQISRERYLGYIACTRANERLLLSYARQNSDGKTLNPSPFIAQLKRIFPALTVSEFTAESDLAEALHSNELIPQLLANESLCDLPVLKEISGRIRNLREPEESEAVSPALAARIYGPVLRTSISRLEEFASCPFKFFMRVGLRANERKTFELDARERGNFQHDVLEQFHKRATQGGKRWRDLSTSDARALIRQIADERIATHRHGLFHDSAETTFAANAMVAALQDFVEVIIGWMHTQYDFDPALAEFGFGGREDALPPWELDLGGGRKLALQGRIDRVDIWRDPADDTLLAVVTDYKSGGKKLEPVLVENGIQLQLLAYLGALKQLSVDHRIFGNGKFVSAGAFYVTLRGKFDSGASRGEVLDKADAKKEGYVHSGRFDSRWLRKFDRREVTTGDQFKFKLNKKDDLPSKTSEARPTEEFHALLEQVEATLRRLGGEIFSGRTAVDPYRKGKNMPCDLCDYRAACRLDEWTHEFRELRATAKAEEASE